MKKIFADAAKVAAATGRSLNWRNREQNAWAYYPGSAWYNMLWQGGSNFETPPPAAVPNADGSYDIYFGPKAPKDKKANWIQTVPGKGWFTILRIYSPLQAYFDKSWQIGEIELVK